MQMKMYGCHPPRQDGMACANQEITCHTSSRQLAEACSHSDIGQLLFRVPWGERAAFQNGWPQRDLFLVVPCHRLETAWICRRRCLKQFRTSTPKPRPTEGLIGLPQSDMAVSWPICGALPIGKRVGGPRSLKPVIIFRYEKQTWSLLCGHPVFYHGRPWMKSSWA